MPVSSPDPVPGEWRTRTANDVLKSRWGNHLAWSTTAAAALHAALFLWSPRWEPLRPTNDRSLTRAAMEAIALYEAASTAGVMPTVTEASSDEPDPIVEASNGDQGSLGFSDWELAGRAEARLEELRRRTSPEPTIVDAETVVSGEDETVRIGGRLSELDFESDEAARALELDRLSAVRPELAFLSPSSWVLIQNPGEVADFMVRRFGTRTLGSDALETVSVSLWIDERGSVEWAEVNRSSGRPEVDELALEFFNEVVSFRPAREQGVRVPVAVIFSLTVPW
jgi:TonB family protein